MTVVQLAAQTWPDVTGAPVLALPLGSTEQHGPHLPLGTDTVIAIALAERLARARPSVWVAPALPYGASGEHAGFAGTLSIGTDALTRAVVEVGRSADAFGGVVLVSGHGGNADALAGATATLTHEGRRVLSWFPRLEGAAAHAGRTETSLLLALDPGAVRLDRAEAGDARPLEDLIGELRAGGVAAVSPNGVLGDPAGASAGEGHLLLDRLADGLIAAFDAWMAA